MGRDSREDGMAISVILLRGVNVGKAKRLPMAEFRELLEGLGCSAVTTVLNSGNAVVEAGRTTARVLAERVEAAIPERFGFTVPVVVVGAKELARIVAENGLAAGAEDASRLLVVFARDAEALGRLKDLEDLLAPDERLLLTAHAAYLHCPGGLLDSRAGEALLAKAGPAVTTRNWATVLKLQALAEAQAGG
jgi:uncharacterized protein (DUF1697 family)